MVDINVVLGTGDLGIATVMAEAKKQGIRYFFIEDESSRVLSQVSENIKYFRYNNALNCCMLKVIKLSHRGLNTRFKLVFRYII